MFSASREDTAIEASSCSPTLHQKNVYGISLLPSLRRGLLTWGEHRYRCQTFLDHQAAASPQLSLRHESCQHTRNNRAPSVTRPGRHTYARHFVGSGRDLGTSLAWRGIPWPGSPHHSTACRDGWLDSARRGQPAGDKVQPSKPQGSQIYKKTQTTLWLCQLSETASLPNWSLKAHTAQTF